MGMFDYIRCEYPLPGNAPAYAQDAAFQSKDMECFLNQYTISLDGRLLDSAGNEYEPGFTGVVNFYASNIIASGPGIYTRNGEDAYHLEYTATFVDGRLSEIKEIENRTERAAHVDLIHKNRKLPTPEEVEQWRAYQSKSRLGAELCLWWGGNVQAPYTVKVIVENQKGFVVQQENGEFEILDRGQLGTTLFDSLEEGKAYNEQRAARWEQERKEYEAAISETIKEGLIEQTQIEGRAGDEPVCGREG